MQHPTTTRSPAAREIRVDIQLLRALAILLVLAHHARFPFVPGGFLGVDIFFVISGYLMTTLIDEGLEKRSFSFSGFFARRVRRILPASYATLVVTAIAAPFLLDSSEYRNFVAQLAGSFGFVVNMVLWKQSEYFGSAAALKPLLHMWSLSVEEQFYLVLPLLLAFTPSRRRLSLASILALGSLGLCVWFVRHSPSAAFYFLPTRAWEMGVGSVVALLVARGVVPVRPMPVMRILAAVAVVAVPLVTDDRGHPGIPALVACLATAVLLLPGTPPGRMQNVLRPLTVIGDRSFSLYLVHWPIFAFANNCFILSVPSSVNALLLVGCVVWMELQYRIVEQPLRRLSLTPRSIALLVLIPVLTVGASGVWMRNVANDADILARAENTGLSPRCDYRVGFSAWPECQTTPDASTLIWGDSYAIALVPGFVPTSPGGVVQATRTVCGPLLGLAPTNETLYPARWAESCIKFNRSVLEHIAAHPEIRTVVLSSALNQYVPGAEPERGWSMMVEDSTGRHVHPQQLGFLSDALLRTATEIRRLGRRVVLVAPPPSSDFDSARCLDRMNSGIPTISPDAKCRLSRASYTRMRKMVLDFIAITRANNDVPVISLDEVLCTGEFCATQIDGVRLYRDTGHLSMPGAAMLGTRMNWGQIARDAAR